MDDTGFDGDGSRAFRDVARAGPIHMLNLVALRVRADHDDGCAATGAEAWAACSREGAPVFRAFGSEIVWSGGMEHMLIGPADGHWAVASSRPVPRPRASWR